MKKTHKNKEIIYRKQDTFNAKDFNNEWFEAGTHNKRKVPTKGNTIMKINKLAMFNEKKFLNMKYITLTRSLT